MPGGDGRRSDAPVTGPRKSQTTTTRPPRGATWPMNDSAPAAATGPAIGAAHPGGERRRCRAMRRSAASRPCSAGRRRSRRSAAPAERDDPEPVAALRGEMADRERDALGDIGLAPIGASRTSSMATRRAGASAVSARSGTWTRTCGTVIRAVTFQSIRRTSSPGSYGRTWASSVPPPGRGPGTPGEQAADPPPDRHVERAEERLRRRAGAGPGRTGPGAAAPASGTRLGGHADALRRGCHARRRGRNAARPGSARSRIMSAVTSSASAVKLGTIRWRRTSWASSTTSVGIDVAPAADDGQGPGGVDEVDRAARAGAEGDERLDLRQPDALGLAGGRGQGDGVVDDRRST